MLRELRVSELRYRAVLEVLDGAVISTVARRYGVSRQTVHAWLCRYAREGAVLNLEDRSSRPHGCPHQMAPELEARVLVLRDANPRWGPTRIVYELGREGVVAVPGRSSVYRALVRNGRIDPARRRRRRSDYKRWERGRPMELWQMDVVGGVHLCDGAEVKVITGIDDNSRFVVSAKVVARATARPVCEALVEALARHGVPEQILTDNGKVFTGQFGPAGSLSEVLFDRVCAENGIRHLLTAPRSPTTTGKVERLHKTMRAEFFTDADRGYAAHRRVADSAGWLGGRVQHRAPAPVAGHAPARRTVRASSRWPRPAGRGPHRGGRRAPATATPRPDLRHAGVQRWVDQRGRIRLAGFGYRVPIVLAGEPVEAVVADNLVQIYHHDVLVGSHVQRRKPNATPSVPRQGRRTPRAASTGIVVTRMVDNSGQVSFAGTILSGRTRLARKGSRGVHRCRVGADQLPGQDRAHPAHPTRPDQRARRLRHPARPTRKPRQDAPHL